METKQDKIIYFQVNYEGNRIWFTYLHFLDSASILWITTLYWVCIINTAFLWLVHFSPFAIKTFVFITFTLSVSCLNIQKHSSIGMFPLDLHYKAFTPWHIYISDSEILKLFPLLYLWICLIPQLQPPTKPPVRGASEVDSHGAHRDGGRDESSLPVSWSDVSLQTLTALRFLQRFFFSSLEILRINKGLSGNTGIINLFR